MNREFKNIKTLLEDGYHFVDVVVENGKFKSLKKNNNSEKDNANKIMIPGFIDEHTHGGDGYDFSTCKSVEEMEKILKFYIKHGVTSVLPTLLTERDEVIFKQLELLYKTSLKNPIIKGVHLEGPFLCKEFKGAQLESCLQKPTIEKCKMFIEKSHGLFKLMTIAPENEGSEETIKFLKENGIAVSLGHSAASFDDCTMALKSGAKCITHMFNAMKGIHQHHPSIASAALYYDDFYTEVILDGIHVHKEMVEFIRKINGNDKVIGVTDSLMAAGLPDGNYFIGETPITVKNHDCVISETGVRAGSTLDMKRAFDNVKTFCNLDDLTASHICSLNCAKMLGIDDKVGSIKEGKNADFLILNDKYEIEEVYINGEKVL